MITLEFAKTMARYNRWQNESVVAAASRLTDQDRWRDRGAFFRSIAETLNHILWDDRIWLARFAGNEKMVLEIGSRHPYTDTPRKWISYGRERAALDDELVAWADGLSEADLARSIFWTRGEEAVETKLGFNLVHMVNHQTHHRGQVDAMLTAAGVKPGPTDLQMLNVAADV
ncbi:MAG: DinB family protein [Pseudomonadota bacterium]